MSTAKNTKELMIPCTAEQQRQLDDFLGLQQHEGGAQEKHAAIKSNAAPTLRQKQIHHRDAELRWTPIVRQPEPCFKV
jgi:hypothetical protein